jgi:hypothetical protein
LWRVACAVGGWGILGAIFAGGAWALGLVVAWLLFGATFLDEPELQTAPVLMGASAGCGLLTGVLIGLVFCDTLSGAAVLAWCLRGTAVGLLGGGLTWLLVSVTRNELAAEVSSVLAWCVAGLLVGMLGYGWRQLRRPETDEDEVAQDEEPQRERQQTARGQGAIRWPTVRLLPILGVAVGCLVAFVTTLPSDAGWAVLAVGLLGLAVAWALNGQERRIRDLERQLRDKQDQR